MQQSEAAPPLQDAHHGHDAARPALRDAVVDDDGPRGGRHVSASPHLEPRRRVASAFSEGALAQAFSTRPVTRAFIVGTLWHVSTVGAVATNRLKRNWLKKHVQQNSSCARKFEYKMSFKLTLSVLCNEIAKHPK